MLQLQSYNLHLQFWPQSETLVADGLSRLHLPNTDEKLQKELHIYVHQICKHLPVSDIKLAAIKDENNKDP